MMLWILRQLFAIAVLPFTVYIRLIEEPGLAKRFGEGYREYCRQVRRFVPRWRPWKRRAGDPGHAA